VVVVLLRVIGIMRDNESGGNVGGQDVKTGKVEETVLLLLSLLYSNENISICDSRPSSCPAYMFY